MSEHSVEGMMSSTIEKIRQMVDVNTIIGDAITTPDGTVVIPVSKVSYGFASGGSDLPSKDLQQKEMFAGGSGAGITITPVGFLTVCSGNVKMIQIEPYSSSIDRIIEATPGLIEKIGSCFKKNKKEKKCEEPNVNNSSDKKTTK